LKTFRKILLYSLGFLLVLIVALAASVYLFQDRIIEQFIREANKSLNTPVKIGTLEVTLLEDFPNLSIVCRDVVIEDSYPGESALLTAKTVSFQLNPWEAWQGTYTIRGLSIRDSETHLRINRKGETNFNILKENKESDTEGSIQFSLKNVRLRSTVVYYTDKQNDQDFEFISTQLQSSIDIENDVYLIQAKGDVSTEKFRVGKTELLTGKDFNVTTTLRYFNTDRRIVLEPSTVAINESSFILKGEYSWLHKNTIDIQADGENTNIQTLLSLLPQSTSEALKQYQSSGDVYFSGTLRGTISETKNPGMSVKFGFNKATLSHPQYNVKIENATLNGSFATSDILKGSDGRLVLNDISGTLNNERFTGKLIVNDFIDSDILLHFEGRLDAASLLNFYPIPTLKNATGSLLAHLAFEGKPSWLKSKATAQKATATGSVQLDSINFVYGEREIPVKNLNGLLQFTNNDLALSSFSGQLGKSDFIMNGFFKNIITFLFFEDQPIGIETDLKARHIDLDELFTFGFSAEEAAKQYEFHISPNVYLNFNCDVDQLNYKRFNARNIKGDLLVKNQVAVSRHLAFESMDGRMSLNGIMDATNPKAIDVMSAFKVENIQVDSIFYVFENFDQTFIQDKHLKGQTTADVSLEMTLNQNLKMFPETLIADISATIKKGELNNFEPLQALNKYLDDEGLAQLRFAELKNDIHIENKTIYIPQMEIRSNVTTLQLSGTHTFDQQIAYKVVAPLRNKKKINIEEAGSALEELDGKAKVFLKITGTTEDYHVQYDGEAVRKKLANDFKKEVQELKDAFKLKGQKKKKELEVTDEEFDWEQ